MLIPILSGLIVMLYAIYQWQSTVKRKMMHKHAMQQERNKQVFYLRQYVSNTFGEQAWQNLPDYATMLNSDKPLVAKEWVEVDKLVNLN